MTETRRTPRNAPAASKATRVASKGDPGSKTKEHHVFYQLPLYYDIVFGSDVLAEVEFYKRCFEQFAAGKVKRVLEPACGSGHYMVLLGKAGYQVTGYDLSPSMVAYTRERIKRARVSKRVRVLQGDMRNMTFAALSSKKFDVAINQINSLAYLQSDKDIIDHFKVTAEALVDKGLYIIELTIKCEDFAKEHKPDETWTVERDGVVVTATWKPLRYDLERKLRIVELTMHVDDHGTISDYSEIHELRLWTHEDIKQLTSAGGFDIIATFDGKFNPIPAATCITGDEYEFPYFVLRKR
ncbi:MAG: class I SAM-dependent methyltransferase [Candidatus Lokiarchaeota archaeon]|nr:class I SAM-dependent methyltransferase [Candidatus Lokiarchaeota archaeon]